MWRSCREKKPVIISYFIFRPYTICIFNFYLSPFHPPSFHLLLFRGMFLFPIIACHKIKKIINKRKFGKEWGEIDLLLMLLVSGLSTRWRRWGGWRKLGRVEAKAWSASQNGWPAGHLLALFPLSSPLTSSLAVDHQFGA
jgi:hypothetical protein